jgi:hypothetical protein
MQGMTSSFMKSHDVNCLHTTLTESIKLKKYQLSLFMRRLGAVEKYYLNC